ncbi:MAG: putative ABC transporter ATP-binding protein [Syntrophus sp. PtaB.Bin001]|nr:MAG: putative ABC transporter ATP-binding protein [Syntrophus sp. PtaB.Bin001]
MSEERSTTRPTPRSRFGSGHSPYLYLEEPEKAKSSRATLMRLWGYLKRQKLSFLMVFSMILVSSVLSLIGPYLIGRAVDAMAGGRAEVDFRRLATISLTLLAVYLGGALVTWAQIHLLVGISQKTVKELRNELFAKLQTLSLRFFDRHPHGELMSRLTNDIENINNTLSQGIAQIFSSVILLGGAFVMMLALSPSLTVLSLLVIPPGIFLTGAIARRTRHYFSGQQAELGEMDAYIEEHVSGARVVKAFGREQNSNREFQTINSRLFQVGLRAQVFSGIVPPLMNMVNNLSFAIVAAVGGWMAVSGTITVGIIASFLNYSKQFARPINELANQYNSLQAAIAGAERVFEVMDEEPDLTNSPSMLDLQDIDIAGDVVFDNVSFAYLAGQPVLKGITLHARPGQTIAIVGPTGAGKTTIVNLLTRFYDIDAGSITIDGHDIRKVSKESLRRSLGIVLQDTYLFTDSVQENIRYGRLDATDEEVELAARLANAHSFIERLPYGYKTVLGEDGGNLSQGQRQLLTIARAILAEPSILILDEATSSVDTRTELNIQEAMLKLMKGRTTFVIAHRLSTIRNADEILVINDGRIIERGTHEQLLKARGFYYDLYNSQFESEVL